MEEYNFCDSAGVHSFRFIGKLLPDDKSDYQAIVSFCRDTLATIWHIHGGCLPNKVVDSHLKVIGVAWRRWRWR
ncbi:putative (R)-mandelonitrile lyase [Helianthus debilis subsp. tardiflorus]